MPLDATIGPARVIEIKDQQSIKVSELKKHNIKKGERLLFKTRNSPPAMKAQSLWRTMCTSMMMPRNTSRKRASGSWGWTLSPSATLKTSENVNKTHTTFLNAGIYILEDCALGNVPPGEYELLCLPLLMFHGDAAPCRAILRPL